MQGIDHKGSAYVSSYLIMNVISDSYFINFSLLKGSESPIFKKERNSVKSLNKKIQFLLGSG